MIDQQLYQIAISLIRIAESQEGIDEKLGLLLEAYREVNRWTPGGRLRFPEEEQK